MKNIDIKTIIADSDWNVRLPGWEQDPSDDTVESFTQLKDSIEAHGIETPLVVAQVGRSKKFRLISGFRRFKAATELGMKTVPAIVKDFATESQARSANLRENNERENLTVQDLTWGIKELMAAYSAENVSKTQRELALEIGIAQSYLNPLAAIATGLDPKLFKAWRESTYDFGYRDVVAVAKLPRAEQKEAWDKLTAGRSLPAGEKAEISALDKLKVKAEKAGALLAQLAYLGIDPADPDFGGEFPWQDFTNSKTAYSASQKKAASKVAQAAYDAYMTAQTEEGEEEAEE